MALKAVGGTPPKNSAPVTITPSGNPYTWQNTTGTVVVLYISGGTVTTIEHTHDNSTFTVIGIVAGSVTLRPLDRVRITYTVAPTVKYISL